MTIADMPWAQGKNPRFDRIATRLAHWTPALFLLAGTWFIAGNLIVIALLKAAPLWQYAIVLGLAVSAPLVGITILTTVVTGWHMYALCPVCARKTPIDPAKTVARKRRTLRALHWFKPHPKLTKWTPIVLLVLSFMPWVGMPAFFALMAWLALTSYLMIVHMPLQPWCPQCKWNGGGDKEVTPDPVPAPSTEKVA
jgi:hypothetical protein